MFRGDRFGRCVPNLFECLGLLAAGAVLPLRCGQPPHSPAASLDYSGFSSFFRRVNSAGSKPILTS